MVSQNSDGIKRSRNSRIFIFLVPPGPIDYLFFLRSFLRPKGLRLDFNGWVPIVQTLLTSAPPPVQPCMHANATPHRVSPLLLVNGAALSLLVVSGGGKGSKGKVRGHRVKCHMGPGHPSFSGNKKGRDNKQCLECLRNIFSILDTLIGNV